MDVLKKVSKYLRQKCSQTKRIWTPRLHANALPDELPERICYPIFWNSGSGGIYICVVKLTFEMLIVYRQQHLFANHEWMFLRKCRSIRDRQFLNPGRLKPPTIGFNAPTIQWPCQTFVNPCFGTLDLVVHMYLLTARCFYDIYMKTIRNIFQSLWVGYKLQNA